MNFIAKVQDVIQHPHAGVTYATSAGGGGTSVWLSTFQPWLAVAVGVLSMIALGVRICVDMGWIKKRS